LSYSVKHPFKYVVLYVMPDKLIEGNVLLRLQWENIKSLIPCLLKGLYRGEVDVKLHELDMIFTGLSKLRGVSDSNVLGKTASLWYYLTKIFHQSMGPRIGGFAEKLFEHWINNRGLYRVVGRNTTLSRVLRDLAWVNVKRMSKVDFALKGADRVALVEVRMSEHTGGRTAQESLLDKMVLVLKYLEDPGVRLRQNFMDRNIREVHLSIAILFSEDHKLLTRENVNRGRLASLVNYIMEERHVWGELQRLAQGHGYTMCDGSTINSGSVKNALLDLDNRKVCIQENTSGFKIWFKILLGDEFFKEYTGASLNELIEEHDGIIADDIWLFYTVLINELKVARQFKDTNARYLYENLKYSSIFRQAISNIYSSSKLSLDTYIQNLNSWLDKCAHAAIDVYRSGSRPFSLLETNNIDAIFEYLKQLCICALAIHIAIDDKKDVDFRECRWE